MVGCTSCRTAARRAEMWPQAAATTAVVSTTAASPTCGASCLARCWCAGIRRWVRSISPSRLAAAARPGVRSPGRSICVVLHPGAFAPPRPPAFISQRDLGLFVLRHRRRSFLVRHCLIVYSSIVYCVDRSLGSLVCARRGVRRPARLVSSIDVHYRPGLGSRR